jgi:peptidoglycan/xylan/chitin deacetylase (PgdA/CDA1 family)
MAPRENSLAEVFDQTGVTQFPPVEEWFLTPDQIMHALSAGVEFGAHTVSHPNLPGIPGPEAAREIAQSKLDLERTIGLPIHHFSYPNSGSLHPHFDESVERRVQASGFDSAVTSVDGWIDANTNRFLVKRIGVNRSRGPLHRFAWYLERIRLASASNTKAA